MKPSRYNFIVHHDKEIYAVNLLSRTAMVWDQETYQRYLAWSQNDLVLTSEEDRAFAEVLVQHFFLLPDHIDEVEVVRKKSNVARSANRQLGLVISPTMGCNFNCHYCFEAKSDRKLKEAHQKKLVKRVAEKLPNYDEMGVQWFGGEPLLTFDMIQSLSRNFITLCHQYRKPYAATIITNGFHMSPSVSALFLELGIKRVQITLDGDRKMHDKIRTQADRAGSFNRILENIKSLPDGIELDIRVHVAPYNQEAVSQLLEELKANDCHQKITAIYFAPLFNYKVGMTTTPYQVDKKKFSTAEEFAQMQVQLLTKAKKLGFQLKDWLDASYGICTAVKEGTFVVDPDGALFKCYLDVGNKSEAFGDLEDTLSNRDNLSKWLNVELPRDEECASCKVMPVCLGGCTKQWHKGADKEVICSPLKYNIEERIKLSMAD
ncbi:MAG: radical SAM protein [Bacteroidota bacterium]